jgi:Ca2+-binding RTX toxin-like protein
VSKTSNEFQFQLAYTVPESALNTKFSVQFEFTGVKTGTTKTATATSSAYFQISDVVGEDGQITTNATDGRTIINLSLHPAGNQINAGAGDDTIHAAAGADTMDGGTGTNWVAYDLSKYGVSVNLLDGEGKYGFAEGDKYTNIHNIVGSTASDTLIGDNSGDSLIGNGGHDLLLGGTGNDYFVSASGGNTIDGGGGFNTVDYSASTTAISANIGAGDAGS